MRPFGSHAGSGPEAHNLSVWRDGRFVRHYANHELCGAESVLLSRHRSVLQGSVLELGCGAGRLTGHLIGLGGAVHGLDISKSMIDYCLLTYPRGTFSVRDLRDLSSFADGSCDAVVATNNVLDVLEDQDRRRVLAEITRILKPGGLLAMSGHNRNAVAMLRGPGDIRARNVVRMAGKVVLMPRRMLNRRRLRSMERSEADYAMLNDDAHHYSLVHYYISPEAQRRQLADAGLEVIETRRSDGMLLAESDGAADCSEVHYVAQRPSGS